MTTTCQISDAGRIQSLPGGGTGRRAVWFTALLLAALTMGLEFAHVLEWPQKAAFPGPLYTRLQETLYLWFGNIGAPLYLLTIALTVTLTILLRATPCQRVPVRIAAVLETIALISFFAVIYPVNLQFPVSGEGGVPADWEALRVRWETGHAIGFVLFGAAFVLLLVPLIRGRRQ